MTEKEMVTVPKEILEAAGVLADAALAVTGGRDINGFPVREPTVTFVSDYIHRLKSALDDYNHLMLKHHSSKKD